MTTAIQHLGVLPGIHEIALDASPYGVIVCDDAGTILYTNPQVEALFGYSRPELHGAAIDGLLQDSSRGAHAREWRLLLAGSDTRQVEAVRKLSGRRRDGSEVPVEINLALAGNERPHLVVATVVPLTERRRLEGRWQGPLARRLAFELLVSELAARFVRTEPAHVDGTITDSLRQIVESLDLDRCALWQFTEDGQDVVHTHSWNRPEFETVKPGAISIRDQFPWFWSRIRANEAVWHDSVDTIPAGLDRENLRWFGTKSVSLIPMTVNGRVVGALSFAALRAERAWEPDIIQRLKLLAAVFAQVLARRDSQLQLERALAEVERLGDQLASENVQLHHEVQSLKGSSAIVTESDSMRAALLQGESVASTDATVLLLGETGCGKEVVAQAIHEWSVRRDRPIVRVNCAAIPTALMESELFGRERGAYTGALSRQIGRFELAAGTTIFLDEVGELPLEAQVKLLRVLQEKTLERLGSVRPIKVDVRVIAATNRDLRKAVAERTFREDLFYRLNVFPIQVPPLRERAADIPILIWTFVDEFSKAFGKRIETVSKESLAALQRYSWPGNVRELRNVIERAVILSRGPRLVVELPNAEPGERRDVLRLTELESDHIREVLNRVGWRVRGPGGAAELLGMKPTTLDSRMAKLGIRRPRVGTP
jgi:formate hydrogenlyase transcriptional activator